VAIPPAGTPGAAEVQGGGTGTREIAAPSTPANAEDPTAVQLTGGRAVVTENLGGMMCEYYRHIGIFAHEQPVADVVD
jgi:hypothetical protein